MFICKNYKEYSKTLKNIRFGNNNFTFYIFVKCIEFDSYRNLYKFRFKDSAIDKLYFYDDEIINKNKLILNECYVLKIYFDSSTDKYKTRLEYLIR